MKYIKTYENYNKLPLKNLSKLYRFKVGDYVYCIDPINKLEKNKKYRIRNIFNDNGLFRVSVEGIEDEYNWNSIRSKWDENRFISELDYVVNKYNL